MNIQFSSSFLNDLESILEFYDARNGNDKYIRKLLNLFHHQINLLATMPDIGRQTNHPHIRILFVDNYGIEYEQIDESVLIIDIYSCLTNPALRKYTKK